MIKQLLYPMVISRKENYKKGILSETIGQYFLSVVEKGKNSNKAIYEGTNLPSGGQNQTPISRHILR